MSTAYSALPVPGDINAPIEAYVRLEARLVQNGVARPGFRGGLVCEIGDERVMLTARSRPAGPRIECSPTTWCSVVMFFDFGKVFLFVTGGALSFNATGDTPEAVADLFAGQVAAFNARKLAEVLR